MCMYLIFLSCMYVLLFRDAYKDEVLVEIYKLLHSTAGRLSMVVQQGLALSKIIQTLADVSLDLFCRTLLHWQLHITE